MVTEFGWLIARRLSLVLVSSLVAACGGGSNSPLNSVSGSSTWKSGEFKSADTYVNKCENPRFGKSPVTGDAYPDRAGSYVDENNFLRSWSNDTYLWYSEIVDRNPKSYSDTLDYFDLLKTEALSSTGAKKDRFHFYIDSDEWESFSNFGTSYGYGLELYFGSTLPPRELIVAYVQPGSPAALANIARGAKILTVDGVDLVNDNTSAGVDVINEGLFPSQIGAVHRLGILAVGASTATTFTLQSANIESVPVQNVKTITTENGKIGYLTFNDHIGTAEKGLADAISLLQSESITDLVLDLRYNGGGYLDIASELAYMIAGATATNGKTFEKIQFNDKYPTKNPVTGQNLSPDPFYNIGLGFSLSFGTPLPTLNLSRVFVLTTKGTCSASESIMNGLRGIGVEVIQVGRTTCGKPYGFYPESNCGTTYFSVQFRGVNAQNFGDYSDGFIPSATDNGKERVRGCVVDDDFQHALGNENEAQLAAALYFINNNACPSVSLSVSAKPTANALSTGFIAKPMMMQNAWKKK